jgi:Zn-dependent protease with chaperone function
MGSAVYFDGQSNRKRPVDVNLGPALEIIEDGQVVAAWSYGDLRRADSLPGTLRLRCISAPPLARLEIHDPAMQQAVEAAVPAIGHQGSNVRQTLRIVAYSAAALASFLGVLIYGVPLLADRLAMVVPMSFERRLGDAVDRQLKFILGGKTCDEPRGHAALKRLVGQLEEAGGLTVTSDVNVMATKLPNALALPGGKVYVTSGLLEKARGVDELAGVIAHELGHLQHRDVIRQLIQDGGTAFLVGLLFGDVTGGAAIIYAARSSLTQRFSRDSERAADAFSVETLRKLGRSPKAMGDLLMRITGPEAKGALSFLSSHPLTEERLATMAQADRPVSGPELLSTEEWRALQGVCR